MNYDISPDAQAALERIAAHQWRRPDINRSEVESALTAHFAALGLEPGPYLWFDSPAHAYEHVAGVIADGEWSADLSAAEREAIFTARRAVMAALNDESLGVIHRARAGASWGSGISVGLRAARKAIKAVALNAVETAVRAACENVMSRTLDRDAMAVALAVIDSAAMSVVEGAISSVAEKNARVWLEDPAQERLVAIWSPMERAFLSGLWNYLTTDSGIICIEQPSLWFEGDELHRVDGAAVEWNGGERYFFWHGKQVSTEPHAGWLPA